MAFGHSVSVSAAKAKLAGQRSLLRRPSQRADLGERALQIGDDVVDVLDADRQPHVAVGKAKKASGSHATAGSGPMKRRIG
jgi:hypothetical protein